jgi:uncharacterized repeat protein (TIGR01451 family)
LTHGGHSTPLSVWLVIGAAVLSFAIADGRIATASFAAVAPIIHADVASSAADGPTSATTAAPVDRPDFRAEVLGLSDGQAGHSISYTVQVRNEGGAAGSVRVSTILPPEFSNVRVSAPGFACTRQFSASGPQAGTVVACSRNSLQSGATADVTVEANAPAVAGEYRLLANADPRYDVAEAAEGNPQIVATVHVAA